MFRISIQEPADHPLVLRVMPCRLALEESDTSLAQCDGDFHAFIAERKILRGWQEVRDDPELAERMVAILDSSAHRFAFLFASSLHRRSE